MPIKSRCCVSALLMTCLLAVAVCVGGCATTKTTNAKATDGVFIHIQSGTDKVHSVLMALRMAQIMAENQHRPVLVYFDIDGVQVVDVSQPAISMQPFGSSHALLDDLVAKGVTLMACPGCMKVAGMTKDQLHKGVVVANKDTFFNFTDGRILTLDY